MASSWSVAADHVGELLSLKRLGTLFYVVSPNATTFETVEEVPNYINEVSGESDWEWKDWNVMWIDEWIGVWISGLWEWE